MLKLLLILCLAGRFKMLRGKLVDLFVDLFVGCVWLCWFGCGLLFVVLVVYCVGRGWCIHIKFRMINKTRNATNDICLIARAEIIEQVAKQPFRKFMQVNTFC
jgi:hypothetical protein